MTAGPVLHLLACGLALFRVAQFIAKDLGPFRVCARLRAIARSKAAFYMSEAKAGRNKVRAHLWREVSDELECVYCTGLWLAPLFAAAWMWNRPAGNIIVTILALAGVQAFLQDVTRED